MGASTETYARTYGWDTYGRLSTVEHPSGVTVKRDYNAQGYLSQLKDNGTSKALVTYKTMDAYGNVEREELGSGATVTRTFDAASGRLETLKVAKSSTTLQDNAYDWRSDGLLASRTAKAAGSGALARGRREETFTRDALGRLTKAQTKLGSSNSSVSRTLDYSHDGLGNLTRKPGVSSWTHESNGPRGRKRLTAATVGGEAVGLSYDEAGRVKQYDRATSADLHIGRDGRGLATKVVAGTGLSDTSPTAREEFAHGPDGAVYLRTSTWDDAGTQRTEVARVFGPYEKRTRTSGGSTTTVERTRLGGGVVHVKVTPATGSATERYEYLHGDQLGSLESASGATGTERGAFAWGPYGSRRKADWTGALDAAGIKTVADAQDQDARDGFTGHQQLDRIGLVHMRGRLYDPALGRFLSPDPVVADAGDGQGWNAYAYARNAPLSWVDPDGRQICDPRQCGSMFGNDPLAGGRGGFSSGTFSTVLTGGFRVAPVAVTASYLARTYSLVRTGWREWSFQSGFALRTTTIVTAALAAENAEGPVPDGDMGRDAASEPIQERFGSVAELEAYLNPGDVIFGKRPLDGPYLENLPVEGFEAPLGDWMNTELLHEQVFYVDEGGKLVNKGFFDSSDGGVVRDDWEFPDNIKSYKFGRVRRNQNLDVLESDPPGFNTGDYNLPFHNCQDYVDAVRAQLESSAAQQGGGP